MRHGHQLVTHLTVAALLAAPVTLGACGRGNRVYDPYYTDYHRWNGTEDGFYRRWEGETGRPHVGFGQRPVGEQHAYFDWRHKR
jgi:hypothetical protein